MSGPLKGRGMNPLVNCHSKTPKAVEKANLIVAIIHSGAFEPRRIDTGIRAFAMIANTGEGVEGSGELCKP